MMTERAIMALFSTIFSPRDETCALGYFSVPASPPEILFANAVGGETVKSNLLVTVPYPVVGIFLRLLQFNPRDPLSRLEDYCMI